MSDFFISDRNAQQSIIDAEFNPAPAPAGATGFQIPRVTINPVDALIQGATQAFDINWPEIGRASGRSLAQYAGGASDFLSHPLNIPNNALETPDYLVRGNESQRAATRRLTDPHFEDRTLPARGAEIVRDYLRSTYRQGGILARDPRPQSEATQLLSGLAEVMTPAIVSSWMGPAGPAAALAFSTEERTYLDMIDRGVSEEVARGAALQDAGFMAAMGVAPIAFGGTGRTLVTRLLQRGLTGAGINLAFGAGMRGNMNAYLTAQGYPEIAREYQYLDTRAMLIDGIMGAVFGATFGHSLPPSAEPHVTPMTGEVILDAAETQQQLPQDADGFIAEARQYGNDQQIPEAYAYALLARELGHPEADDLIARIEEEADAADLDSGRAIASEIVDANLSEGLRGSDLAAAAIVEAGRIQDETAFGIPENQASRRWASEAQDRMEAQAARDEPIDPGPVPEDVSFVPLPDTAGEHWDAAMRAFEEEARDAGLSDVEAELRRLREDRPDLFDSEGNAMFSQRRGRGIDAERRSEPFQDERLTPQQNKAVEMARNNYSNAEIADELEVTSAQVAVLLSQAKARAPGLEIPGSRLGAPPARGGKTASTEEIVSLYNRLSRQGYRNGPGRPGPGRRTLNTIIAERLGRGMTADNVAKRLSVYRADLAAGRVDGEPLYSRGRQILDARNGGEVIANPTQADMMRLTRPEWGKERFKTESLRYIQDADGNIYVGRSYGMTHDDIAAALLERGIEIPGYQMHMGDRYSHGDVATGFIHRVGDTLTGVPERRGNGARFSTGEARGSSASAELIAEAEMEFGADWTTLQRASLANVHDSFDALPQDIGPRIRRQFEREAKRLGLEGEAAAAYVADAIDSVTAFALDGKAHFIADRISPEEFIGKILHEIGFHNGMEVMLGPKAMAEINRHLTRLIDEEHPLVIEAMNDAMEFGGIDRLSSEGPAYTIEYATLANLIENRADLPLVQRVLSRLRQWLIKTFGSTFGMRLTVDDLRALAITSLRRVAEQARRNGGDAVEVRPVQEAIYASQRPDAGGARSEHVVDAFHGTGVNIDGEFRPGSFFASEADNANTYARDNVYNGRRYDTTDDGGRVYPVRINTEGFETIDMQGRWPHSSDIEPLRERGVPGVILENVEDAMSAPGRRGAPLRNTRQYVVFDTSRLEPRFSNRIWRNKDGSFVHEDANMVESGPYAAFQQRVRPQVRSGPDAGPSQPTNWAEMQARVDALAARLADEAAATKASSEGIAGMRADATASQQRMQEAARRAEALLADVKAERANQTPAPATTEAYIPPPRGETLEQMRERLRRIEENAGITARIAPDGGPVREGPNAGGDFPQFSMRRDGQNGENLVGAKRDPIEGQGYQRRVAELRSRIGGKDASQDSARQPGQEPGGAGRVRGDAETNRQPIGTDAQSLRDVLAVSGIRLFTRPNKTKGQLLGRYRLSVDTPVASDADSVLLASETASTGTFTRIDFDFIDGSNPKETRLPGVHIAYSRVANEAAGLRVGEWMYRQLIDWAARRGLPVYSDGPFGVSKYAQRTYRRLEEAGFVVEEVSRRVEVDPDDGALVSKDGLPVFRVSMRDPVEPHAIDAASPPREDYQIDGPTLRERQQRIDEQRARQEQYDKLSGAEQVIADDPEMPLIYDPSVAMFSRGGPKRRYTARQALQDARAEADAAAEMRKGFEAAARCAARRGAEQATRASVVTAGVIAESTPASMLGQTLGLTLAIPVGITAAPLIAQAGNPRRYAEARAQSAAQSLAEAEARFARDGAQAGRNAGLDAPTTYNTDQGEPLWDNVDTSRRVGDAPPADPRTPMQEGPTDLHNRGLRQGPWEEPNTFSAQGGRPTADGLRVSIPPVEDKSVRRDGPSTTAEDLARQFDPIINDPRNRRQ